MRGEGRNAPVGIGIPPHVRDASIIHRQHLHETQARLYTPVDVLVEIEEFTATNRLAGAQREDGDGGAGTTKIERVQVAWIAEGRALERDLAALGRMLGAGFECVDIEDAVVTLFPHTLFLDAVFFVNDDKLVAVYTMQSRVRKTVHSKKKQEKHTTGQTATATHHGAPTHAQPTDSC